MDVLRSPGYGSAHRWQLATAMEPNHNYRSPQIPVELPFDVLEIIFAYYAETETLFHPLETLLLVSRWWNLAAINHKALWGNLHIHLGHKPTHDAWKILLPRRLQRVGSALLSIEIRYALEGPDHPYYEPTSDCAWFSEGYKGMTTCSCVGYAADCAQDLLEILTGPEGKYCWRWKTLHVTLGGPFRLYHGEEIKQFRPPLWCDPFSYPTPLLESIYLKGIDILESVSLTPFPSTPLVHTVHFEQCNFDSLDGVNFSSAESITIQDVSIPKDSSNILKFDPPTAIKVIHIDRMYFPLFKISRFLPHLHTLYLGEDVTDLIAPDFDFPSLKTLTLPVSLTYGSAGSIFLERFISSTNHSISTVKFLTLSQSRSFLQPLLISLKPFLEELESIERITAGREILALTLKYILEATMQREGSRMWRNLSGRTLKLVRSDTGSTVQLVLNETIRAVDICAAGRIISVPDPTIPWEQYLEDFQLEF